MSFIKSVIELVLASNSKTRLLGGVKRIEVTKELYDGILREASDLELYPTESFYGKMRICGVEITSEEASDSLGYV
jgi:hypothetical protein